MRASNVGAWLAAILAAVVCVGGEGFAAHAASRLLPPPVVGGPSQDSPPADTDFKGPKQAAAWLADNADTTGWQMISYDEEGVALAPEDVHPAATFEMAIRVELLRPLSAGPSTEYLSVVGTSTYDCAARRQRLDRLALYAERGLKGPLVDRPIPGESWKPLKPDNAADAFVLSLCDQVKGGATTGEGPASMALADVDAWIEKTVKPQGDIYAYYDDNGAYYVRGPVTRLPSGAAQITSRLEHFTPNDRGARSETMKVELDCRGKRLRLSDGVTYTRHNLEGPATTFDLNVDWVSPQDGLEASQLARLCELTAASQ